MNPFLRYKPNVIEIRYDTPQDARMRLSGSFLRFKDIPVWCRGVDEDLFCNLALCDLSTEGRVHSSDEALDISSPPLGMMNTRHGPLFVQRSPLRQQKQGFDPLSAVYLDAFKGGMPFGFDWTSQSAGLPVFGKMLARQYPSILEAMDKDIYPFGAAFSPEYSIALKDKKSSTYLLTHNSMSVGYFEPSIKTFIFLEGDYTKTRKMALEEAIYAAGGDFNAREYQS